MATMGMASITWRSGTHVKKKVNETIMELLVREDKIFQDMVSAARSERSRGERRFSLWESEECTSMCSRGLGGGGRRQREG